MEELIDLFKQMFYRSKIEELEIEGDLNKIKNVTLNLTKRRN